MNRRVAALVVAVSALVLLLSLLLVLRHRRGASEVGAPGGEAADAGGEQRRWEAKLWLPSESGVLAPIEVLVQSGDSAPARARGVVNALLAVRPEAPLDAVFPAPVRLSRLLVIDGTAYVDLRPEEGGEPPSAGSRVELLRVYSIVHTVTGNVPEIHRVVLLWNGVQRQGFPGHVDTARPLVPLRELEAG